MSTGELACRLVEVGSGGAARPSGAAFPHVFGPPLPLCNWCHAAANAMQAWRPLGSTLGAAPGTLAAALRHAPASALWQAPGVGACAGHQLHAVRGLLGVVKRAKPVNYQDHYSAKPVKRTKIKPPMCVRVCHAVTRVHCRRLVTLPVPHVDSAFLLSQRVPRSPRHHLPPPQPHQHPLGAPCRVAKRRFIVDKENTVWRLQANRRHGRAKMKSGTLQRLKRMVPLAPSWAKKIRKMGFKARWWYTQKS